MYFVATVVSQEVAAPKLNKPLQLNMQNITIVEEKLFKLTMTT